VARFEIPLVINDCGLREFGLFRKGLSQLLHILTGPTAVGKTQLALEWALTHHAEIVSCDSLLFYRGMDIGTAKPSAAEQALVPHHCIDLVDPSLQFSIGNFLEEAKRAVHDIHSRGKQVLVTGGSGFYLKGFVAPVVDDIVVPEAVEKSVTSIQETQGLPGLVEALKAVAPDDFSLIDLHNERRVVPALKRCLATGKGIAELRRQVKESSFPFSGFLVKSVLLQRSMETLIERIAQRTDSMLQAGLIKEVQELLKAGLEQNPSAAQSIGYREVIAFLRGELDRANLAALINANTVKLVKKQQKWFRHQMQFDRILDLDAESPDPKQLFE